MTRHACGQGLSFDMTASSGGGKWFILLIPKGASKGSAALHVSRRLGFSPKQVMVAGDGENDVPLFEATIEGRDQGFKGAVVGNAVEGLKTWVARSPSSPNIHRSMSQQVRSCPPCGPRPTTLLQCFGRAPRPAQPQIDGAEQYLAAARDRFGSCAPVSLARPARRLSLQALGVLEGLERHFPSPPRGVR